MRRDVGGYGWFFYGTKSQKAGRSRFLVVVNRYWIWTGQVLARGVLFKATSKSVQVAWINLGIAGIAGSRVWGWAGGMTKNTAWNSRAGLFGATLAKLAGEARGT